MPWIFRRHLEELTVSNETLTITDNRTGKKYELPITDSTIKANDLRQIKISDDDFGLMTYDPSFMSTAACRSAITFIDGDKGILRYRGYPIEQLAEKATFLEIAYLLNKGELPTQEQLDQWTELIKYHTYVHTNITPLQVDLTDHAGLPVWRERLQATGAGA